MIWLVIDWIFIGLLVVPWILRWQIIFVGRMVVFLIFSYWRQIVFRRRTIMIWLLKGWIYMSIMEV